MASSVRLQLLCRNCEKPSTVHLDVSRVDPPEEAKWACPSCETVHRTGVIGRVVFVRAGFHAEPNGSAKI